MLKAVNLLNEVNNVKELYYYQLVGEMNGHGLRVVNVADRTLDFHVHEKSDELFYVIEGGFDLETEDGLLPVKAGEFIIVPRGTKHRPVVKELTEFLMIELDGTLTKENSGDAFEV